MGQIIYVLNKVKLKITILVLLLFSFEFSTAKTFYSNGTGGGPWGTPTTWSPLGPPACGDTIYIVSGDIVTIQSQQDYSACGSPMFITIDTLGVLDFNTSGPKLRLPCGSGVIINSGGLMTSTGGGGGATNKLEICGNEVWRKSDGPQTGPQVFGTPLPIELISFTAHVNNDEVTIKWITATEINNDYFTIERSSDIKNWEVITTLNGAGNSTQIIEYYEVDYSPLSGISYYRLKQTDYDGKYTYSNVVPVKYENTTQGNMNLFPNPIAAGETLNLSFDEIEEDEVLVVLRDITGKEFYSKLFIGIENNNLIGLPIEKAIPSGIYLITATSENRIYSQKLIVK